RFYFVLSKPTQIERKRRNSMRLTGLIALPLIMAFVGCADLTTTQKGAAVGGLGGAAAGGLGGSAVHHPVAGALVGGALGAGSGALIGNQLQGQQEFNNNSKNRLTGKVLSYNGRERS